MDIDHHIVNFRRAVKADPGKVAHHRDLPTFQADLTARHGRRVLDNADYRDARVTCTLARG